MRRFLLSFFVVLVFSATSFSQTATEEVIASFSGAAGTAYAQPNYPLIQAQDGNFYGISLGPGSAGYPGIFRVTPAGVLTAIYTFENSSYLGVSGSLTQGPDGNLYGLANAGEMSLGGAVFKLTLDGKFSVLYPFTQEEDGGDPNGALILGDDGNFYGTTFVGGPCTPSETCGQGSVFRISPSGTFTSLLGLVPSASEGSAPVAGLVQATDGNFYGVTTAGGANGYGTIFKMTPSGTYTNLFSFAEAAADNPTTPAPFYALVQGADGNLYGNTVMGGTADSGMFFRSTTGGAFTLLYSYLNDNDGFAPNELFATGDGNFYTTAAGGNPTDYGAVISFTSAGKPNLLYDFQGPPDGAIPHAGVIQANDGSFYGTTGGGGSEGFPVIGSGAVYRLSPHSPVSPPVQLSLSQSQINPGSSVTLSWKVLNAFSLTMRQCYAFVQNSAAGAGTWTGKQAGTYSFSTKLFTGLNTIITPTANGTYTYALTCGGQESGFATLIVGYNSNTALSLSPATLTVGQSATLSATVTGSQTTPTGTVAFSVDGISLGSAKLNGSGVASLTASSNGIGPGSYPIVATYSGDSTYGPSDSKALPLTLAKAPTSTSLTVSPNPVTHPASGTLTATVSRTASGAKGTPTGSITFSVDGVTLGSAKLNSSGIATLTASSAGIKPGSYPVIAKYSGDTSDSASTSAAVNVTVQ